MGPLYTPEEVAKVLRVARATVYRLIRAGTLLANRVGSRYRVSEEQIQEFLNQKQKGPS